MNPDQVLSRWRSYLWQLPIRPLRTLKYTRPGNQVTNKSLERLLIYQLVIIDNTIKTTTCVSIFICTHCQKRCDILGLKTCRWDHLAPEFDYKEKRQGTYEIWRTSKKPEEKMFFCTSSWTWRILLQPLTAAGQNRWSEQSQSSQCREGRLWKTIKPNPVTQWVRLQFEQSRDLWNTGVKP